MNVKAEWKSGPDFAEYAEVLGIETRQIMAVSPGAQSAIVIYTPELDVDGPVDMDTPIYMAQVARDQDDVLVLFGEPVRSQMQWRDMAREIEAEIERRLNDRA